ncbi:MAG: hypothetical protein AVDCRST_MAG89-5072, partial [uncultured Gemmatimonadetes bacterium]
GRGGALRVGGGSAGAHGAGARLAAEDGAGRGRNGPRHHRRRHRVRRPPGGRGGGAHAAGGNAV